MCQSFLFERLNEIDKSFAKLPSYHMKAGMSHSEAVDDWYLEIGASMLNRVAIEATGEGVGPLPVRNLMDFPDGISDADVVRVCQKYGDTAIFSSNGRAYLTI